MAKSVQNNQEFEIGVSYKYQYAVIKGRMIKGYIMAGALALFGIIGGKIIPSLSSNETTITRATNEYVVSYNVTNDKPRYGFEYAALGIFLGTGAFLGVRRNSKDEFDELDATTENNLERQKTMLLQLNKR